MSDTNIGIIITAKDLTGGALNSVRSSLGKVQSVLFSVKSAMIGIGAAAAVKSILSTASSFEQMNVSMETVVGSSEKAREAMNWIKDFTAKTPYELEEVNRAFIKLSSYGLDATKNLQWLGNTASAMGKSLDSAVEALADAVSGEFERLKEFGVRTRQEGDNVTFAWTQNGQELTKTVSKTSEDITKALQDIFVKFDGGMAKQSETMGGILSNLSDMWTGFVMKMASAGAFDGAKAAMAELQEKMKIWSEDGTADKIADSFGKMAIVVTRVIEGLILSVGAIVIVVQEAMAGLGVIGAGLNVLFAGVLFVISGVEKALSGIAGAIAKLLSLVGLDSEARLFQNIADDMATTAAEAAKWSKAYMAAAEDAMAFVGRMGDAISATVDGLKAIHETFNDILAAMVDAHKKAHDDMVKQSEEAQRKTKESLMQMMADIKASGLDGDVSITFKDGTYSTSAKGYADGGVVSGGFRAFANGGVVNKPTLGLIGEGHYNEAVVPLPDGRSIPVELRGAAGSQIINLTVNISTLDSKSFDQYIKANPKAIIDLFVDGLKYGGVIKTAVQGAK